MDDLYKLLFFIFIVFVTVTILCNFYLFHTISNDIYNDKIYNDKIYNADDIYNDEYTGGDNVNSKKSKVRFSKVREERIMDKHTYDILVDSQRGNTYNDDTLPKDVN